MISREDRQMNAPCTAPRCLPRHGRAPTAMMAKMMIGLAALVMLVVAPPATAQQDAGRMAFVVGNAAYAEIGAIPDATRDARGMAETLEQLDFRVTLLLDSDGVTFDAAFDSFARRAETASAVLFYFAGHGVQADGQNRLALIDMHVTQAGHDAGQSVPLDHVVDRLATGTRPALFMLDASRDISVPSAQRDRLVPGLTAPGAGRDSLIALAARPGQLIPADGSGVFTRALRETIATPGQPVAQTMREMRDIVTETSGGRQVPWVMSTLSQPFFFNPFRPDADDFARLAAMPEAQQDFLLDIWRSQGAHLPEAEVARRLDRSPDASESRPESMPESVSEAPLVGVESPVDTSPAPAPADPPEIAEAPEPLESPEPEDRIARAAPDARATPQFSFEFLEDEAPEDDVQPAPPLPPTATARDAPTPAASDRSAASTAQPSEDPTGAAIAAISARAARAPSVADTPIARIGAMQPPVVLASVAPARNLTPQRRDVSRIIGTDVTDTHLAPDDLPRAVQTELARLGCYTAGIDGIWGGGSRGALQEYISRSGAQLTGLEPTGEVWRDVKAAEGTICPAPAVAARPAPAPRTNTTPSRPAPRAQPAPQPSAPPAAPPAASGGGGDGADGSRLRRALGSTFR